MTVALGDTYIPQRYDNHLWVIISDPALNSDFIITVNLTDYAHACEEKTCVLEVGDHPFIKKKSVIRYRDAMCTDVDHLTYLLDNGKIRLNSKASLNMLQKIWLGAALSRFIKLDCLNVLEEQNLLPD